MRKHADTERTWQQERADVAAWLRHKRMYAGPESTAMLARNIERGDHHGFVGRVESMTYQRALLADIPRIAAEQRAKEGWELTGTRRMDSREDDGGEHRWLLDFERVVTEC